MLPTFSKNSTLQEEFETAALINEELNRTEFDDAFCQKNSNFWSIDFVYFFKHGKLVEKMIHEKKVGATERSRSLNPGKAIAMAICPIARARWYWMYNVACEFACAVKMRRTRTSSVKTQHSGTDRSCWICVWRKLGQGNNLIILTPLLLKSSVFSNFFSLQPKTKSPCLHMPLVWRAFSKITVFKTFLFTWKRKAPAFKSLLYEERFRKAPFSQRISVDRRPNRRKKAALSFFNCVVCTRPKSSLYFVVLKRVWTVKGASVGPSGWE